MSGARDANEASWRQQVLALLRRIADGMEAHGYQHMLARAHVQMCPVCKGDGKVYAELPAYTAAVTRAIHGHAIGWSGDTHEWRLCAACGGRGLVVP